MGCPVEERLRHQDQPWGAQDPLQGSPWGPQEWVVKVRSVVETPGLLYGVHTKTLDQTELADLADSIAVSFGVQSAQRVEPFRDVFKLQYDINSDLGEDLQVSAQHGIQRRLAELDKSLEDHPSLLWAARQHCLVRQKRGGADLQFNDPMFHRQWHLVSTLWSEVSCHVTSCDVLHGQWLVYYVWCTCAYVLKQFSNCADTSVSGMQYALL